MATNGNATEHRTAVIGNSKNFWLYSSRTGFDLTHPSTPDSPPIEPRVTIETTTSPITIDPAKTALIIIDMQNFFLSPAMGRDVTGTGHQALKQLVDNAVPAARKAGIRVVWLNWGLTQQEVDDMPPAIKRAFGFEAVPETGDSNESIAVDREGAPRRGNGVVLENGKDAKVYKGLGEQCGLVDNPETGKQIDAGRLLMRDQWNAALCRPLNKMYEEGLKLQQCPDVWIHKNRMSGMWGPDTALETFLRDNNLSTCLFTGVNTDQCVAGTLTDAYSKGFDICLLSDGAATSSPSFAQECMLYNSARSYGFVATCAQFAEGVANCST